MMIEYLAHRIVEKALTYEQVVGKYPKFEEGIRNFLIEWNRTDLIPGYIAPEPETPEEETADR